MTQEDKTSHIVWEDIRVGDVILCKHQEVTKFAILVIELPSPKVMKGMITNHDSVVLNNKIHTFASTGALWSDTGWEFDIVPGSGRVAE